MDRKVDRKAAQRRQATSTLTKRGVAFEAKNNGCHLIVQTEVGRVDFWPGTGLFEIKQTGERGHGLSQLLELPLKPMFADNSDMNKPRSKDAEAIRDKIAMEAMLTLMHRDSWPKPEILAQHAYAYADAMMEVRAK